MGRSRSLARWKASSPQGYQSTGLCACWGDGDWGGGGGSRMDRWGFGSIICARVQGVGKGWGGGWGLWMDIGGLVRWMFAVRV
jgi:hypothetical protein